MIEVSPRKRAGAIPYSGRARRTIVILRGGVRRNVAIALERA